MSRKTFDPDFDSSPFKQSQIRVFTYVWIAAAVITVLALWPSRVTPPAVAAPPLSRTASERPAHTHVHHQAIDPVNGVVAANPVPGSEPRSTAPAEDQSQTDPFVIKPTEDIDPAMVLVPIKQTGGGYTLTRLTGIPPSDRNFPVTEAGPRLLHGSTYSDPAAPPISAARRGDLTAPSTITQQSPVAIASKPSSPAQMRVKNTSAKRK